MSLCNRCSQATKLKTTNRTSYPKVYKPSLRTEMYAHPTQGLEFPTKRLSGNHYSVPKRTPKDLDQRFMTRLFSEGQ